MQDEAMTTNGAALAVTPAPTTPTEHSYYEVGGDLFSKPNALGDILEATGLPNVVIYCTSPSDADLVDVLLRKRGMNSTKLVGHAPPGKAQRALKDLRTGTLQAVVVTDVAAEELDISSVPLVINYTMPADPEVYLHRSGQSGPGASIGKVISLISPLDIANFHYLKKFASFPITKGELPTTAQLQVSRFSQLRREALDSGAATDERMKVLADQVLADADKAAIVAFLLRNTVDVLPSLRSPPSRGGDEGMRGGRDGGSRDFGGRDFGGRDRGGDRRDSRGRGDRRDGRNNRRDDDRGDRRGRRDDFRGDDRRPRSFDGDGAAPHGEGSSARDEGFEGHRNEEPREEREFTPPPPREVRLYIGKGRKHGFDESKFTSLLTSSELSTTDMKHFRLRDSYAFADFNPEVAEAVVAKLNDTAMEGGALVVKKAIQLGSPREFNGRRRDDGDRRDGGDRRGDRRGGRNFNRRDDDRRGGDRFEEGNSSMDQDGDNAGSEARASGDDE